ncbi:hypothetical protein [Asaia astilbis]|uniref:hypothetical protein n=1 Tax=Asaia astilbis TaxID=610244 RepID=UPI0004709A5C|nr:hypothetical protein [Asaia astilbis]
MIIIVIAISFWSVALFAHAMLQPKMLRVLTLTPPPRLPLQLSRIVLPVLAVFLCWQLPFPYGVLAWFGTASVGGILASGFLTYLSARNMKRLGLLDKPSPTP